MCFYFVFTFAELFTSPQNVKSLMINNNYRNIFLCCLETARTKKTDNDHYLGPTDLITVYFKEFVHQLLKM